MGFLRVAARPGAADQATVDRNPGVRGGAAVPDDPGRPPGGPGRRSGAPDPRGAHNVGMDQGRAVRAGIGAGVLGVLLALAGFGLAWGPGHRSLTGLLHDSTLDTAGNGVWISVLAIVLLRTRPGHRSGWGVVAF